MVFLPIVLARMASDKSDTSGTLDLEAAFDVASGFMTFVCFFDFPDFFFFFFFGGSSVAFFGAHTIKY